MTQNIPNAQIPDNSESSLFATMAFHNEPEFVLPVQQSLHKLCLFLVSAAGINLGYCNFPYMGVGTLQVSDKHFLVYLADFWDQFSFLGEEMNFESSLQILSCLRESKMIWVRSLTQSSPPRQSQEGGSK